MTDTAQDPVPKDVKSEALVEPVEIDAEEAAVSVEIKVEEVKTSDKEEVKPEADKPAKVENSPGHGNRPKNVKFDASLLPKSNDPAEIRKQIEFYLSDSNLPFDKFLWTLVTKDNKAVPLRLIATFKRMRRFEDYDLIVAAMRESKTLEIAGDEGEETVRRRVPIPIDEFATEQEAPTGGGEKPVELKKIIDRSLKTSMYAKGFGGETPTTQIDVERMAEPYGPVNSVRLRRDDKMVFKGSVFIEFGSVELLQKFAAMESKPTFNGKVLDWKTKEAYVLQKQEDIAAGRIQPSRRNKRPHKFNAFIEERLASKEPSHKDGHRQGGRHRRDNGRGGRGRGRGRGNFRGGRGGGNRNGNASPVLTDKYGVPQLVDTSEPNGNKRKAEDGPDNEETKKPKVGATA